jgi:alkaline phosphatase
MKKGVLIVLIFVLSQIAWAQNPLRRAHAHNDYEHTKPFYEAFQLGFGSIESDVYAVNGELLVAHDVKDLKSDRTLKSLYLDPIMRALEADKQGNFHQFLIDCKTASNETLPLIIKALEPYAELIQKRKLRIVISGNRPAVNDFILAPAFITFDGRSNETYGPGIANKVELESEAFYKFGIWDGQKPMSPELKSKLKTYIDKVHAQGRKIRLWATPDTLLSYQTFYDLGADYLGTDHLSDLADYLRLGISK